MSLMNEAVLEESALGWFSELGFHTLNAAHIAPGEPAAERVSFRETVLEGRLRDAIARINPDASAEMVDSAVKEVTSPSAQSLIDENLCNHRILADGVGAEYRDAGGAVRTRLMRVIDFEQPDNNDWLAANQFTIVENKNRWPDLLVFVNGLPLALFELKNPIVENATLQSAWNQIQTYRSDIPSVFRTNVVTVISDGIAAAMSSFTGAFEHYAPWKSIDSPTPVDGLELEVLIKGVFEKKRFLDLVRNFVVFSSETINDAKTGQAKRILVKRVAKYHQFWAVNAAVESTVRASSPDGDRRGGVVWHTQGSGKSFEMVFYAAKIMQDARMMNPTLVFITDRNDLDDQLFTDTFAPAHILPEIPVQADSRADLRKLLTRASGGIVFTTLHKFALGDAGDTNPVLTERRNVVVIADEAHRSQYGLKNRVDAQGRVKPGLAKSMRDALPGATSLGFTGTPIDVADKSTRAVFGDYIDVYDLTRAVQDGATVKIYYEARVAPLDISRDDRSALDDLVEEIIDGVDENTGNDAKSKWSHMEAIVGAEPRLERIADDIDEQWTRRKTAAFGKAMIVTMSRRIAVRLYDKLVAKHSDWHDPDPKKGKIKVIITGSAASEPWAQPHIYSKKVRQELQARAKDPVDPLEIVIVCDMWLTGFDAPVMHTMYVDKSMRGAGLMQAIARVNRRFRDKDGGLIVDYIGLLSNLEDALAVYSPSDREQAGVPIDDVINVMLEKHDVIRSLLHKHEYDSSPDLTGPAQLQQIAGMANFVLADDDRAKRFLDQVLALVKAHALAGADDRARAIADDVRLFTSARVAVLKLQNPDSGRSGQGGQDLDTSFTQLMNAAVAADKVVDIYARAGMNSQELSLLSDEFLESLKHTDQPNLQEALLRRLMNNEIRSLRRSNIVQAKRFSEMLDEALTKYTNRTLSTAEIIAELVKMAKEMKGKTNLAKRAEELGLRVDEVAFYDAVAENESAVLELGDETLKKIVRELVTKIRNSVTIDWRNKQSVQAQMRSQIKRILARYKYPPDARDEAIELVIEQAALLADEVVAA
ncbi:MULTISPECIES: type I restriction endonuclease subunit R [Microbacterium]|uniref:type I restriction endonuclease subunit R n=1 Tax=Microbacterium TaxID=33882 RepID=UPI000418617C|nr:type I restriction endonuclease subunit R [Microbacterium gubbeenense]